MSSLNIKDTDTREAVRSLERKMNKIDSIRQLPSNATLKDVIIAINKLTNNIKR